MICFDIKQSFDLSDLQKTRKVYLHWCVADNTLNLCHHYTYILNLNLCFIIECLFYDKKLFINNLILVCFGKFVLYNLFCMLDFFVNNKIARLPLRLFLVSHCWSFYSFVLMYVALRFSRKLVYLINNLEFTLPHPSKVVFKLFYNIKAACIFYCL